MPTVQYQPSDWQVRPSEAQFRAPDVSTGPGYVAEGLGRVQQAAQQIEEFQNRTAATQAVNDVISQGTALLRGDPGKMVQAPDGTLAPDTGFLGLRGKNALDAAPQVAKQLNDIIQQGRSGLKSAYAQQMYDASVRRYQSEYLNQMGSHTDQQQFVWAHDVNTQNATLGINAIAADPYNDKTYATNVDQVRAATIRNAQLQFGSSPEIIQAATMHADQNMLQARIGALLADGTASGAVKAKEILDTNRSLLGTLHPLVAEVEKANINATLYPAAAQVASDAINAATKAVGDVSTGKAFADYTNVPFEQVKGRIQAGEGPASLGGYNAQVGNKPGGGNKYGLQPQTLTGMTMGQVYDYQRNVMLPATKGARGPDDPGTSAVGAYQIVSGTLASQAQAIWGDKWRSMPFSPENQDIIAKHIYDQNHTDPAKLHAQWPSLGGVGAGQHFPSVIDAMEAQLPYAIQQATAKAATLFPDRPDAQEKFVATVQNQMHQQIAMQKVQIQVNSDVVSAALGSASAPTSEDALVRISPQVAQAWDSLKKTNPALVADMRARWAANAEGPASGFGVNFKEYLDRVLAPANDPNRVANPLDLNRFVGPGEAAPLTNTGASMLGMLTSGRGTPQGEANAAIIKQFVDTAHSTLTFSNPAAGIMDPKGEAAFSKYMAETLPVILDAQKKGTLGDILNPQSKGYIGGGMQNYARPAAKVMQDRLTAMAGAKVPGYNADTLASALGTLDNNQQRIDAIKAAIGQKRITAQEGAAIGAQLGLWHNDLVPRPAPPPHAMTGHADPNARFVPKF